MRGVSENLRSPITEGSMSGNTEYNGSVASKYAKLRAWELIGIFTAEFDWNGDTRSVEGVLKRYL
jgi:hypothetical protein